MITDTDILEMLAQGASNRAIRRVYRVGSARIAHVRALNGFDRVRGMTPIAEDPPEEGPPRRDDDPLGDALERAGYIRHTVKSSNAEFSPRLPSRSAFDTQSIMGSHF